MRRGRSEPPAIADSYPRRSVKTAARSPESPAFPHGIVLAVSRPSQVTRGLCPTTAEPLPGIDVVLCASPRRLSSQRRRAGAPGAARASQDARAASSSGRARRGRAPRDVAGILWELAPQDAADGRIRRSIEGIPAASYSLASNPALVDVSKAIGFKRHLSTPIRMVDVERALALPAVVDLADRLDAGGAQARPTVEADRSGRASCCAR